jgi:hypothetical protein
VLHLPVLDVISMEIHGYICFNEFIFHMDFILELLATVLHLPVLDVFSMDFTHLLLGYVN